MKILFVCWANVGRSQMAAAFYNNITNTNYADAAGTEVENPGETLGERRLRRGDAYVIDAMKEEGIDISGNKKTQLIEEMLSNYDLVISMADKEYTPSWLSQHPKYEYWDIKDPGGKGLDETNSAKSAIKSKIVGLISRFE